MTQIMQITAGFKKIILSLFKLFLSAENCSTCLPARQVCVICVLILGTTNLNGQIQGLLKGYVIDKKDNQKIYNANIIIFKTQWGTVTNQKGYFELPLPAGNYSVEARMIGYKSEQKEVLIEESEETGIVFELQPEAIILDSVEVVGRYNDEKTFARSYELLPGELKNIPQVGEADPLRALFTLPGVSSISDFSNQLFIRGGNFDETLIALDDVPLYNPYHLGGLFTSINADIIGKEKVYLSNYPVDKGGYLSGTIQLLTKNVQPDIIRTSASIGLLSSKGIVQGPLGNGTFIAAARRTYFDLLIYLIEKEQPYYFYDLYGKYSLPLDENNLLQISALYTQDVFHLLLGNEELYDQVEEHPNWGNLLFNTKFTHLFDEKSSFDIQLYLSNTYMNAEISKSILPSSAVYIDYGIRDITLNLNYKTSIEKNKIETGSEIKSMSVSYDWLIGYDRDLRNLINPPEEIFYDYAPNPYSTSNNSFLLSSYVISNLDLFPLIGINVGLRGTYLTNTKSFHPSPFLSMMYDWSHNIKLNFSYGRYYQFLYTIKERKNESIYAPFSTYFLPDNKDEVGAADNFSLGIDMRNLFWDTELEADVYYKYRQNLASSYNEEPRYRFENGYTAGVDISLKKTEGWLTGWVGYSFSRAIKHGKDFSYYSSYDRTHNVKVLFNFKLSEKWHLSAFWTFASGTPYTRVIGKYISGIDYKDYYAFWGFNNQIEWRPVEGAKNAHRMGPIHRLDLGITGSFVWGNFLFKPYFQVLNIYNSPNSYFYRFKIENGEEDISSRDSFIVPSIGISVDF